ncbi:LLM class flavin-dependent oxidoreductase, partial [Halobacteriales archaeon QS_1_68_44]
NWQDGDREAAMAAFPDELLEQLAVWGTPETARAHFERFTDIEGVEAISVSFPRGADLTEIESTMRALAPE